MRDAELLLRHLAYKNFISDYSGNLKRFLDETTKRLNHTWDNMSARIENQANEYDNALQFTREIFGPRNYLRKWNGREYEKRINRAVVDIMTYYFSEEWIRDAAQTKKQNIERKFREMCERDATFLASLERTTKSIEANITRFRDWAGRRGAGSSFALKLCLLAVTIHFAEDSKKFSRCSYRNRSDLMGAILKMSYYWPVLLLYFAMLNSKFTLNRQRSIFLI